MTESSTHAAGGEVHHPPLSFAGVPRDIDCIKAAGWTQVVLHAPPTDELISQATNDEIVRIALLALMLRAKTAVDYVDAEHGPPRLISAMLHLSPAGDGARVQTLSFDEENYYRATLVVESQQVDVWTQNEQMQVILETAARDSIPVEFDVNPDTMELIRVKVNVLVPLPEDK